jgi:hypothetical protein
VRGFEDERFSSQSRRSEGRRIEPEGAEVAGDAREGGSGQDGREGDVGRVDGRSEGEEFVREYEEDDVPAEGRVASA